ncbi:GH92 family glycosyl hydrolase [Enterococcus camelliae]|uniref:GH92 family glycosyl hydrolase n=1 Tax=Enterococcus camelliae TaxID=453959 RepID=A0ABW5TGI9_9ENTE
MKKTKMALLAMILISGSTLFTLKANAEVIDKKVLFHNSFEDTETKNFLNTTKSTKGSKSMSNTISQLLTGNVTNLVDTATIQGSSDNGEKESKGKIFDNDLGTKWLSRDSLPVWVSFSLKQEKIINSYSITSGDDASGRDPKNWEFYGSSDGKNWVLLDTQSNQTWSGRLQEKNFNFKNDVAYKYFKLNITQNNGDNMTQFSEFDIATGNAADDSSSNNDKLEIMSSIVSNGPSTSINQQKNVGWTGKKALKIEGEQTIAGESYSYNDIFDVNIPVEKNTHLSYVVFPDQKGEYDYSYMSMHVAIDLQFTDGTYLSDLAPLDQNGNTLTPENQGKSRTLLYQQWNKISSDIGKYANGKTIDKIVVGFHDSDQNAQKAFAAYFDDIEISNYTVKKNDRKSDYVNILRGTNDSPSFSRGLTAPAVTTPHGFNFWAPVTNSDNNKLYDYQQNNGEKFQHMTVSHEPSYWVGDRGTWQFMVNSSIDADSVSDGSQISTDKVASEFSHDNETAKAHLYKVDFADDSPAEGTSLALTPSEHGSITQFTFNDKAKKHNVIFDSVRANGQITIDPATNSFSGYTDHTSNGMTRMYVYGTFDQTIQTNKVVNGKQAIVSFGSDVKNVEMKVATSFISADQAKKNHALELADTNFKDLKEVTQTTWDKQLDAIDVEGATENQLTTLYSSMYRLLAYPNKYSENTGTNEKPVWKYSSPYSGKETDGILYSNNGFWDTYRTAWSAYSILSPKKYEEMLNGLVQHYDDNTWVPRWIAPGGTNSMVGTSSDIIFADAISKNTNFDQENAYLSAVKNASVVSQNLTGGGRNQLNISNFIGYVPYDKDSHGFSWSMEGYINDYGIARMAEKLGHTDEAAYFYNRALNYQLLFDKKDTAANSWFKGKTTNGEWSWSDSNFDPTSWAHDYTETNAYNMSVSVPFDGQGLVNLYGSREALAEKIDSILTTPGEWTGGNIHEMYEAREVKLGQYGHSNQPSHHILYMYNYAGQPWKTQKYVRDILKRAYVGSDFGQGYIGDEDNGEMSAWYILSSLGIYPLNVGSNEYAIGSPLFTKATVHLENGKDLTISAPNNSDKNIYVQNVKVNGKSQTKNTLTHEQLMNGGTIEFDMGSEPNKEWGSGEEDVPTSLTKDKNQKVKSDMLQSNVTKTDSDKATFKDLMITDISDANKLVDNNSDTETVINNQSVVYKFKKVQTPTIYTITSGKNSDGQTFDNITLSGSSDGKNWETVDSRDNVSFKWSQYTKPFAISEDRQQAYRYFKIDFKGKGNISEFELLGNADTTVTKADLESAIAIAEKEDQSGFDESFKTNYTQVITQAKDIVANPESQESDYQKGIQLIDDILYAINNRRDAYKKIEAETYDSGNVLNDGQNIGGVKVGFNAGYRAVDFSNHSPNYFEIRYAGQGKDTCDDATVEVYADSLDTNPIFSIATPPTAQEGWSTYKTTSIQLTDEQSKQLSGVKNIYLKFVGTGKSYVCNVDWFRFATKINVTTSANEGGTVSPTGTNTLEYGDAIQYSLAPLDGYYPAYVEVNGEKQELSKEANSFKIEKLLKDMKVQFYFEKNAETDIPVDKVTINTSAITIMKKGNTLQLKATVTPENATNKQIVWESQNSSIATVDENGLITAVKAGITKVTAISTNGVKTSFTLRVSQ